DDAVRLALHHRPGVRPDQVLGDLHRRAADPRIALGDACLGDLGTGEDAPGNTGVADRVGGDASRLHGRRAAVHGGGVGEHDLAGHVAAGVDMGNVGGTELVTGEGPAL